MITAEIIAKKRDGHALSKKSIAGLVNGFVSGDVADYQMSAFAMAVCVRGMDFVETTALTTAMWKSGRTFERITDKPRVDKHSTGGLGDKVSLVLAPLLAAAGAEVPMISGRGLGHTGGTLDKLESIPGFQCQLDDARRNRVLRDVGACIVGADANIAPADQKLYALRDVTATIESIPLITASILSKKLSANLDALVMDIKVGSGAFMKSVEEAQTLARSISQVGRQAGLPSAAILSDMNQPLGRAIGNAIEVNEALDVLEGRGAPDVRELCLELASCLLQRVELATDEPTARKKLTELIDSGLARETFVRMVEGQGGRFDGHLPLATGHPILAPSDGYVISIDSRRLGRLVQRFGGGRQRSGDAIDPSVGICLHCRIGDAIESGQPLMTLHYPGDASMDYSDEAGQIVHLDPTEGVRPRLVLDRHPFSIH